MAASVIGSAPATSPRNRSRRFAAALVLPTICLLPIVLCAPFFTEPFERDEGTYATIAQGLLQGEVPYRDLFDHKPPLIYLWYAVSFLVFGEGIVAPRLMAALVWSLTTLLVYLEGKLLFGQRTAQLAGLFFAASSGLVLLQANANTEAFMVLPLTASLYAFTRALRTPDAGWLLLAGAAGALAVLTKQVAALNLVAGGMLILSVTWRETDGWQALRRILVLAAGSATILAMSVLAFALAGALDEFFYANWTYNRLYATEIPINERFHAEIVGLRSFAIVAAPILLLTLIGLLQVLRVRVSEHVLLLAWLAAGWVGISLSGRAFPHYYVTLLPSLALLASIGVRGIPSLPWIAKSIRIALYISTVICVSVNANVYLQPTPEERHAVRFSAVNPEPQNDSPRFASYIAAITEPDDTIYNYGRETQLYFYADRLPGSRFIYDRPFWLDPATLEVAVRDLRATRPTIIVDTMPGRTDPAWQGTHPPAMRKLLDDNYVFVNREEFADIYRLKE